MQIIYILVAFKLADYMVKKYFEKGVKKRCEIAKKRCEIANIKEFSIENLCKPYIFMYQLSRRII